MAERFEFSSYEREEIHNLYSRLKNNIGASLQPGDEAKMKTHLKKTIDDNVIHRDVFGLNPILFGLQTAMIVVEEIGLRRDAVMAIMLHPSVEDGFITIEEVKAQFGESVARILHGLQRIA